MADIEFHESDEWTAVYLDGKLIRVGDHYLADEWLREYVGVKTVQDDAFFRGGRDRAHVAPTLADLYAYVEARQARLDRAAALREEAERLESEADALEQSND